MPVSLQELQRLSQESTAYLSLEPLSFPPQTPLNVKATGERMLIRVQWAPVDDVDGYRVAVMTNQNLANPNVGLFTVSGEKQLEFVYSTGNTAITRFFAVQSFSGTQFSEFSPVVSATSNTFTDNNLSSASTRASHSAGAEAVIRTITVAANTLGANDGLNVDVWGTQTISSGTNTVRIRWGGLTGTIVASVASTAAVVFHLKGQVFNRNASNSQFCGGIGFDATTVDNIVNTTAALDTTVAQTLVITGENSGVGTMHVDLVDTFIVRGTASAGDSAPPAPPSNPPGSSEPPEYNPRGTI